MHWRFEQSIRRWIFPIIEARGEFQGGDMPKHRSHRDIALAPGAAKVIVEDIVLGVFFGSIMLDMY